jgi:putative NADPH-quinone reductase
LLPVRACSAGQEHLQQSEHPSEEEHWSRRAGWRLSKGHPDPGGKRLCRAIAEPYAEGAAVSGRESTRIEVAGLDFPILRTQEDFEHGRVPEILVEARDVIVSAQYLVIVFPLWHGTMPAVLRASLST